MSFIMIKLLMLYKTHRILHHKKISLQKLSNLFHSLALSPINIYTPDAAALSLTAIKETPAINQSISQSVEQVSKAHIEQQYRW